MTEETEWIRLARQGDQAAFGRLVVAYQTAVYNLAYRMLGDAYEAEDATQEAFIRAYSRLGTYDPQRSFRTWLLSITSHHCIDRLRRRRINWLPLEDEIAVPVKLMSKSPDPEAVTAQREQQERVQQLLGILSPVDRAAVTLLYWYDYSYQEIADVLDTSVSAIKSRLYRARRALARHMETEREVEYAM